MSDLQRQLQDRLDIVLVNVPAFDAASGHLPLRALDLRLAEITALFAMETFGLQLGEIKFAANHDAALASGSKDFCLIQKIGHIFHGAADDVAAALLAETDACRFLTGHIMERGGYYYLHDQCVLVNRRAWETLGRPAFGTPTEGPQRAAVPRRSVENVHDDYTPLFLEPTGEERDWQGAFGYGWQAISESLRRGAPVLNWSEAARRWKRNCYAYYGNPAEWQRALADVTITTPTADDGLRGIVAFLKDASVATAPIQIFGDDLAVDVPHLRVRDGVDCVVASAQGFGVNRILEAVGFHDQTDVVFTDARPAALALKRLMIERWDGYDLAAFLKDARKQIAADFPTATFDPERDATQALLNQAFGQARGLALQSQDRWLKHWERFRALRHEFVVADAVADPTGFCGLLRSQRGAIRVLSVGDAFNAFPTVARFDGAHRRKAYDMALAALKAEATLHLVVGRPPLVRIRGV